MFNRRHYLAAADQGATFEDGIRLIDGKKPSVFWNGIPGLLADVPRGNTPYLSDVFVGMMVGVERTVVPLIGEKEFGLVSKTAIVSFIVSFGVTKAICNLFAACVSESVGRKKVLVLGWPIGLPVPFIIILANHWFWFDIANILAADSSATTVARSRLRPI